MHSNLTENERILFVQFSGILFHENFDGNPNQKVAAQGS